jgi:hypothetical protein
MRGRLVEDEAEDGSQATIDQHHREAQGLAVATDHEWIPGAWQGTHGELEDGRRRGRA